MENLKSHTNDAILTSCDILHGEKSKLIKEDEQLKEERKKVGWSKNISFTATSILK